MGLVHADTTAGGRPLDELDAEVAASFARGPVGRVRAGGVARHARAAPARAPVSRAVDERPAGQLAAEASDWTPESSGSPLTDALTPRELEVLEAARPRADQPGDRQRAGRPRGHGQVPRQEHPAQARGDQPRRRGLALRPGPERSPGERRSLDDQLARRLADAVAEAPRCRARVSRPAGRGHGPGVAARADRASQRPAGGRRRGPERCAEEHAGALERAGAALRLAVRGAGARAGGDLRAARADLAGRDARAGAARRCAGDRRSSGRS